MKCRNCIHYSCDKEPPITQWCNIMYDVTDFDTERRCKLYAPVTNADRIRDMSDEELAAFLADFSYDSEPTRDEVFNWLQQPAEEDKEASS